MRVSIDDEWNVAPLWTIFKDRGTHRSIEAQGGVSGHRHLGSALLSTDSKMERGSMLVEQRRVGGAYGRQLATGDGTHLSLKWP